MWRHWYSCFGLLVMSPLGFKGRVDNLHAWQRCRCYMFPKIPLSCDTSIWHQHISQTVVFHVPANRHWWGSNRDLLDLGIKLQEKFVFINWVTSGVDTNKRKNTDVTAEWVCLNITTVNPWDPFWPSTLVLAQTLIIKRPLVFCYLFPVQHCSAKWLYIIYMMPEWSPSLFSKWRLSLDNFIHRGHCQGDQFVHFFNLRGSFSIPMLYKGNSGSRSEQKEIYMKTTSLKNPYVLQFVIPFRG